MIRILKIPGPSAPARKARLEHVAAWMGTRGWRLTDYADEARSAMFERPPDATRLGLLDATRWLPGPGALRPAQWVTTLRADPRLFVVPGVVLALLVGLGLMLFGPRSFNVAELRREAAARNWYVVTANQLNVRDGPDSRRQQVGVLYKGQRVLVEGDVNSEWVRISIPARGYVAKAFLDPAPVQAEEQ
ncbi:MAG TPA: SH3 domain-containing protein [bacterium]|nr:SH3 domain-containing protein [bacterium]